MKNRFAAALAGVLLLANGAHASDELARARTITAHRSTAVRRIHPVSGPEITAGEIVFEHGKITGVGRDLPVPDGAKIIDVTGKHIYPGLISAHTVLGLTEVPSRSVGVQM